MNLKDEFLFDVCFYDFFLEVGFAVKARGCMSLTLPMLVPSLQNTAAHQPDMGGSERWVYLTPLKMNVFIEMIS
jgi:hypothetical protein